MIARARRSPLVRRITGYSAGSVIAAATSELAFTATLYFGHTGTAAASAAGFVGGAVPNYFLNRRWAWADRRGRNRRAEILFYAAVAVVTFVVSTVGTGGAESWARHLSADRRFRVLLTAGVYLAISGVFFVVKFVLYDLVVFTKGGPRQAAGENPAVAPTRSRG